MGRERARVAVYALAGFYLLYMAYEMFQKLDSTGGERGIFIGFMIFFAVAGAAILGGSLWYTYKDSKNRSVQNDQGLQGKTASEAAGTEPDEEETDTSEQDEPETDASKPDGSETEVAGEEIE